MSTIVPSVESLGASVGKVTVDNMESAMRSMLCNTKFDATPGTFSLRTGAPHMFGNFAMVNATSDASKVLEAVEPLTQLDVPAGVLGFDPSEEAIALILSLGFMRLPDIPGMAVDIEGLQPASLPEDTEFLRVPSSRADEWEAAFAVGYDLPQSVVELFGAPVHAGDTAPDSPLQFFAALQGGKVVATSTLYLNAEVAGIYCVSTLPEYRGKGIGAYMTAEPLRLAQRLGYRVGVLQASDAGYGVYVRLGFRPAGSVPMFLKLPS